MKNSLITAIVGGIWAVMTWLNIPDADIIATIYLAASFICGAIERKP